ncbi:hypothetical protein [Noviherbaspirillum pedocola]|uniref:Glycosyltransferase RgtA/B/C/D-like domain-containing protein n=1 Tax=Noviherbaspirillum pedocola TaxID=2801341 RepID=A0A934SU93_9BURK|nr:hypothetical protein [Noviherbaspirillum pedocola]MBK4736906.1 hypothetical protein [Noviherbaspirillum pedocola]
MQQSTVLSDKRRLANILFAETNTNERHAYYLRLLLIVLLTCTWLTARGPILFPLDDAYITLHNASVLVSGFDRNYVGAPALAGATSSVHLALVTALSLIAPPTMASFLISEAGTLLYVLGLARLAFELGGSRTLATIAVALGALSGYAPYQLLNGLETGLAMAGVTWAIVFAVSEKPSWKLAALCGILPFLRPELAALSMLLVGRQEWMRSKSSRAMRSIALDFVIAALIAFPWFLWTRFNTGHLFPETMSAKAMFFAESGLPAAAKFATMFFSINVMTLAAVYLGFVVFPKNSLGVVAISFCAIFLAAYYLQLPGALHHNYFRYIQILTPLGIFSMLASSKQRPLARYLIVFSAALLVLTLPRAWGTYVNDQVHTERELKEVAAWSNTNIPQGAKILVHDAGYISYATSFQLFDLVGLKTPESIPFHTKWTAPSNGAKRDMAVREIAMRFRPDYAVILDDGFFWGNTAVSLKKHGWSLETLRPATHIGDYAVFKLNPPVVANLPTTPAP